jgi:hypothetical protein
MPLVLISSASIGIQWFPFTAVKALQGWENLLAKLFDTAFALTQ